MMIFFIIIPSRGLPWHFLPAGPASRYPWAGGCALQDGSHGLHSLYSPGPEARGTVTTAMSMP